MKQIALQPSELNLVREILAKHIPDREVRIFGSRYNGRVKPFSDLDLVIMGDATINPDTISSIHEAFSESNISFKVDIIEWVTTSQTFRRIINQNNAVIFP